MSVCVAGLSSRPLRATYSTHVQVSITSVTPDLDHRSRSARQPEVPPNRDSEFITETVTSVTETVTHVSVRVIYTNPVSFATGSPVCTVPTDTCIASGVSPTNDDRNARKHPLVSHNDCCPPGGPTEHVYRLRTRSEWKHIDVINVTILVSSYNSVKICEMATWREGRRPAKRQRALPAAWVAVCLSCAVCAVTAVALYMRLLLASGMMMMLSVASGCSDWIMDDSFGLSVRTMDLGPGPTFSLKTQPKGHKPAGIADLPAARYGHIISIGANLAHPSKSSQRHLELDGIISGDTAFAGLNEAGLSCDLHALVNSSYPPRSSNASANNLMLYHFCNWALGSYATAADVRRALEAGVVHLWGPSAAEAGGECSPEVEPNFNLLNFNLPAHPTGPLLDVRPKFQPLMLLDAPQASTSSFATHRVRASQWSSWTSRPSCTTT